MSASSQKATTEEIVAAYRETGSVWKAAKRLGMAGQSVHERLQRSGTLLHGSRWTDEEVNELRDLLSAGVSLGEAARRLGRPFAGAASKASALGFKVRRQRVVNIPRGAGFDKASIRKYMDALDLYRGSVTQYARSQGLSIEHFVQACQRHFPERWESYVREHSDLPSRICTYCEQSFIPANGKQAYCTRECAADARRDRSYFGGKRRQTIGLADGVCQLCGRHQRKGLSSHHVLGKENDLDNEILIALCQGCHKLVTLTASRKFVGDPAAWEALISLAWLRRHGGDLPADHDTVHVTVEIETYADLTTQSTEHNDRRAA